MQSRLGGSERDAQGRRDLGQRHPQEVVQDDDARHPRVEAPERRVEQVAIGDGGGRVRRRRPMRWAISSTSIGRATPTACHVDAGMDDEPMEPGIEPIGIAKLGQVPPGADEPLLDRVARELRVAEDQPGCRVQPRDGRADEHGEGVMIASLARSTRSRWSTVASLCGTPSWSCSDGMASVDARIVPARYRISFAS